MKKLFTTILLVCAFMSIGTLSASAQKSNSNKPVKTVSVAKPSLQGNWVCNDAKSMMGDEMEDVIKNVNFKLTFGASDFSLLFDFVAAPVQDGMAMEMGIKLSFNGTYSKKDKSLYLKPNPESVKTDLYKFSINLPEEQKAAMKAMGVTEESLKAMIAQGIKDDKSVQSISDAMSQPLVIKELTNTTLVLTDEEGKTLTFTRK